MIKNATTSIDLAHFYLSNKKGERLEEIINALLDAADRGIQIRILTDVVMQKISQETINLFKDTPGISVRIFNWKNLTGGILHAKYMIVDRKDTFIGSQNFDWIALRHIHKTGIRVKSKSFSLPLLSIFEADWQLMGGDKKAYTKLKTARPFSFDNNIFIVSSPEKYSPPGVKSAIKTLIELINSFSLINFITLFRSLIAFLARFALNFDITLLNG